MAKCYVCNKGSLAKKKVPYKVFGKDIGQFGAEVCGKCGETFFDEAVSRMITQKTKTMRLWGLESRTKIGAVGTALDIRLSKKIVDFMHIKKGKEVVIYPESDTSLRVKVVS